MSREVDNRIVEMQFNNAQFEKGVQQSIKSLDKLEESLKLEDAGKGLDEAASKFSALEVIATGALLKIGSAVTDLGMKITKQLSIDQVMSGFSKYEQELRATQTIMNATGESIETVNEELSRLMWYTDETSYSYGNMVDNISKFTAQGIELDRANTAIQGIANMAGLVGATVTDASHAMDGFSKAMAAGGMTLQNWKWIQTAHMETVQTKQAFIDAAIACGTLTDAGDGLANTLDKKTNVSIGNFTETLHEGWLTSEVMMSVFEDMASYSNVVYEFQNELNKTSESFISCSDAMEILEDSTNSSANEFGVADQKLTAYQTAVYNATGKTISLAQAEEDLANWTETMSAKAFKASQQYRTFQDAVDATADAVSSSWKKIFASLFGDAEQATQFWTEIGGAFYSAFAEPLEAVTEAFSEWNANGGWQKFFESVQNIIKGITNFIEPLRKAFRNLFPIDDTANFANALYAATEKFEKFTRYMQLSDEAAVGLENVLTTLLTPLKWIAKIIKIIVTLGAILLITIQHFVNKFFELFQSTEKLQGALSSIFGESYEQVLLAWKSASEALVKTWNLLKDAVVEIFASLKESSVLSSAFTGLLAVISTVLNTLSWLLTKILNVIGKLNISGVVSDIVNAFKMKNWKSVGFNILAGIGQGLSDGVKSVLKTVSDISTAIIDKFESIFKINSPSLVMVAIGGFIIAGLLTGLKQAFPNVLTYITGFLNDTIVTIGTIISSISSAIGNLNIFDSLLGIFKRFVSFLGSGIKIVKEFFKEIGLGKIILEAFAASIGIITLKILGSVGNLINGFASLAKGLGKLSSSIGSAIEDFGSAAKKMAVAEEFKQFASMLKSFAIVIGVAAASILALSFVDKSVLDKVTTFILILVGEIGAILIALTAIAKHNQNKNLATSAGEAISNIIVSPIKTFNKGIKEATKELMAPAKVTAIGTMIMMIGTTVIEIAAAMSLVDNLQNPTRSIATVGGIVVALGILIVGVSHVLKQFKKESISMPDLVKFGTFMLTLGGTISLMAVPMIALGLIDNPAVFVEGMIFISAAAGFIKLFVEMIKHTDTKVNTKISDFAKSMLAMSIAIDLMLIPFAVIKAADFTLGDAAKGTLFFAGAMAFYAAFYAAFALLNKYIGSPADLVKFSQSMIMMAVAIDLMTVPFVVLKGFNANSDLDGGAIAIATATIVFLAFGFMAALVNKMNADIVKFSASMILMAAAIDLMTIPFSLLKELTANDMLKGSLAITAIGVIFAGLLIVMSNIQSGAITLLAASASLLIISTAVGLMAGVIAILAGITNIEQALQAAGAIGLIMAVLGGITAGLAALGGGNALMAGGALLLIAGGFVAMAEALKLISNSVNPEQLAKVLDTLIDRSWGLLGLGAALIPLAAVAAVFAAGVAVIAIAFGVFVLAATPFAFAVSLIINGITELVKALDATSHLGENVEAVTSAILQIAAAIGQGIVIIAQTIVDNAGVIVEAVGVVINAVLASLLERAEMIAQTLANIIAIILETIGPVLINLASQLFDKMWTVVQDHVERFCDYILEKCDTVISKIKETISWAQDNTLVGSVSKLGANVVNSLTDAIFGGKDDAYKAGAELGNAAIEGIAGPDGIDDPPPYSEKALDLGHTTTDSMAKGMTDVVSTVSDAGAKVGTAAVDGIKKTFNEHTMRSDIKQTTKEATADGLTDASNDPGIDAAASDYGNGIIGKLMGALQGTALGDKIASFLSIEGINGVNKAAASIASATGASMGEQWRKAHPLYSSDPVPSGGGGGGGSSSKAAKQEEKSIEDLADAYKYGEGAIKTYVKNYGPMIDQMEKTEEVTDIATKAVDTLALKLYSASEEYQMDLKNADLKTEEVLQHIQQTFNKVVENIKGDISSLNIFREREEQDPLSINDLVSNVNEWSAAVDAYETELLQFSKLDIPDSLRRWVEQLGFDEQLQYMQAFNEASYFELDEIVENWTYIMEKAPDKIADQYMAALAKNTSGMEELTLENMTQIGDMFTKGFANAIEPDGASSQAAKLATNAVQAMRDALQIHSPSQVTFEVGTNFVLGLSNSISGSLTKIYELSKQLSMNMLMGLRDIVTADGPSIVAKFTILGSNIVAGLQSGIEANRSAAIRSAVRVAVDAYEAACEALDIGSPSKKFKWLGQMCDEGIAEGFKENTDYVTREANNMTSKILDTVNSSLNNEFQIKPLLDLSDIRAKAGNIGAMLNAQRVAAFEIQNGSNSLGTPFENRPITVISPIYWDSRQVGQVINENLGALL